MNIGVAIIFAVVVSGFAFLKRWLSAGGAVAAAALGAVVWVAGGWQLALPLLFFFISGSLFSKLPKTATVTDEKSKQPRDHIQVLSNGGIALACLVAYLLTRNPALIAAYFLSLAISTADTWASELGQQFGGKVVDISSGKLLPKGMSGGVSLYGSLAGLTGSLLIAAIYYFCFEADCFSAVVICTGGFAGMLLDSLLGSLFQARYLLSNGKEAEYIAKNETGKLEKGWAWVTNDLVNLLSNLGLTLPGLLLLLNH